MIDHPDDARQRQLKQRLQELRKQLDVLTGGEFLLGEMSEELSLEQQVAFLEEVVSYELTPETTLSAMLREAGYETPDPASLSDPEIGLEVWQVIQRLSELRVFLYQTNHLSDRELYERLYNDILQEATQDTPISEDSACHIDLIGSGSDEHIACWLRYYADEGERQRWQKDFPEDPIPPHEDPPHQRDHLLPKRDYDIAPLHQFINRLLDADWEDANAVIRFSASLTEAEVREVPFFCAARVLLEALRDGGKAKATAKRGDLPRALVKQVFPLLPYPPAERRVLEARNKVLDEQDLALLHQVRSACEYARLLRKYKGHFVLTRKGASLLDPARAGELYRTLFIAYFRQVSLAYFDGHAELPGIQATLPVILWRMGLVAQEWLPCEELQIQTLLPDVLGEIEQDEPASLYRRPWRPLEVRLWRHLCTFGLLEPDKLPGFYDDPITAYRVTPLFSRFLDFDDMMGD